MTGALDIEREERKRRSVWRDEYTQEQGLERVVDMETIREIRRMGGRV